ncbi:MAG: ABC transporter permease [Asgard group archaeon]|nr:ABC transporter permease [Asgard group archaeon]
MFQTKGEIKVVPDIILEAWLSLQELDIWIRLGLSAIFLVLLLILSFWQRTNLEGKLLWSFLRGIIQVIIFGLVLGVLFALEKMWVLYLVLLVMCLFAAFTNYQSYPYPRVFLISLLSITSTSLAIMTLAIYSGSFSFFEGIIPEMNGEYIIPMGSMVIAFAMRVSGIALERVKSDIMKMQGTIEAALILGDSPTNAIRFILRDSYRAGLIPTINRVAVLGIVTIPGLMAGMIIGGVPPIEAAIYQVVIFLMLLLGSFSSSIITNYLFIKQFFTKDQQFDLEFLNKMHQIEDDLKNLRLIERWKKISKIGKKRERKKKI